MTLDDALLLELCLCFCLANDSGMGGFAKKADLALPADGFLT